MFLKYLCCLQWYATMMHYTSEFHGIRTHYLNAFTIREHYEVGNVIRQSCL